MKSNKLNIFETVLTCMLAVTLGVAFWGWTFVYEIFSPFLSGLGLKYLSSGPWLMAAMIPAFIIRKPGVALGAETLAAVVQGFLASWGLMSGAWGLVQGLGAEVVFLGLGYKKWNIWSLILASMVSATFSYGLDFFYYGYRSLPAHINILQWLSFLISGAILCALPTYFLCQRLKKTGLLNNFRIVRGDNA
ncbi:MAG: hypothetical protein A2X86_08010 [Bdellovibrionales bacterium GWA2_49_15]|nr:MAG: hypothetical protein A2X86_08010 [Bdellovibrionales bacterium GWA2_49_15]HAZ11777.1 hypothetical protein [Bdellovibrionales bacterium]